MFSSSSMLRIFICIRIYVVLRTHISLLQFQILISIIINWSLCAILTTTGVFTDDPKNVGYNARTDARSGIIRDNPWFTFTYPGSLINTS